MNHAQPVRQRQLAGPRRQAGLLDEAFGDARHAVLARFEVGQPGRLVDQAQPFLALAQRLFGLAAFGDVEVRADRPDELAVLVALHPRAAREPTRFPVVGSDDPELRAEALVVPGDGAFDLLDEPADVVGMDASRPALAFDRAGSRR